MQQERKKDEFLDRQASDFLPSGFDPLESMRILTDYMRNLEIAFNDLTHKTTISQRQLEASLRASKKTIDDLEQEKERLTKDLLSLSNQVEDLENQMATANHKLSNYEKQSKKLHRDNEDLETNLIKKENDNNFYLAEVDRLRRDFEMVSGNMTNVNNRADDLERRLAAERAVTLSNEKETRHLSSLLSESQSKITILEQKLIELDSQHGEELKKLNEKLSNDSKHEVTLLKKRLKMAVTPELEDLEKLTGEKLSAELASNLKALLSRFISKIEQVGFEVVPK
ncbi:MAG: hypothetical protein LBE31_11340 [Deltaproteobacteria bacterium]|jgi:chromosome segregation ATPase|nr:hypothetical protein [Deltaproteobacteria bacterium]